MRSKMLIFCFSTLLVLSYAAYYFYSENIATAPRTAKTELAHNLILAAMNQTEKYIRYNGAYVYIPYPNGDVPQNQGVCTDVIIRAYRQCGIDLQQRVHEDMRSHFDEYPKLWNRIAPDPNIDHRRVLNLRVFFKRHGKELPVTRNITDYRPGDLVTWNTAPLILLNKEVPHIGLVTDKLSSDGKRLLIVHHRGGLKSGPKVEDRLFAYPITGHYRYEPIKFC